VIEGGDRHSQFSDDGGQNIPLQAMRLIFRAACGSLFVDTPLEFRSKCLRLLREFSREACRLLSKVRFWWPCGGD
jgi:hypothetical protein